MTTPQFWFGGQYLPLPRAENGVVMQYIPFGAAGRTPTGRYRVDHTGSAWVVDVFFEGLTAAERAVVWSVWGGYISTASRCFLTNGTETPLDFYAMTGLGSWRENVWMDPHNRVWLHDVSFRLEEVPNL